MKLNSLVAALFMFACAANAKAEPLTEAALREVITGNTLTGRSTEGRFFSEYHEADGRVLGNNGYYENIDACWTTKSAQICYYYGEGQARTTHCFILDNKDNALSLTVAPPSLRAGMLDAFAKIEKGNPRNHSDNGKSWTCDGLISGLPDGLKQLSRMDYSR